MTATNAKMQEVHNRVTAAVARSVAKGVAEREAFGRHLRELMAKYPAVAAAYMTWLASRAA